MNTHIRLVTPASYLTRRQAERNLCRMCGLYAKWIDSQKLPYVSACDLDLVGLTEPQIQWVFKFVDLWERATAV